MHEVIAEVAGNLIPVDVSVSAGEAIPVEVGGGSGGGGGLSNAAKDALLQIARKVVYVDAGGATYYNALYEALYPLASISAVYTQSGTVYDTDTLDSLKTDLVVTATYGDGGTATVAAADYTLSGTLTTGTSTITVTYQGKTATFTVTVTHAAATLSYIEATYVQGAMVIYDTDPLSKLQQGLTVTAYYSDSSSHEVNVGSYTLSGTLTAGTSTITATYQDKSDTFSVTVTANTVAAISAVYTQSGTVYTTDSLNSLKTDLVVTATYADSSTSTVAAADYTLSGTLTAGTSTVTVSYGGQTTTFSVTVTEASPIPAEYQQVDYIRSTGVEYIDTGLYGSQNTRVELSMQYLGVLGKAMRIFGARTGVRTAAVFISSLTSGSDSAPYFGMGGAEDQYASKPISWTAGEEYEIAMDKNGYTINGTSYAYSNGMVGTTFTTPHTMCIFNARNSGTVGAGMPMKLYSITVKESGTAVFDGIPCYRKSDGVVGLYDTVSDSFFTNASGCGAFEIDGVLPSEYQQVSYLENTGSQYINTGVYGDVTTEVDITVMRTSAINTSQRMFGDRDAVNTNAVFLGTLQSGIYCDFRAASTSSTQGSAHQWDINKYQNIRFNWQKAALDGSEYAYETGTIGDGAFTTTNPLLVFNAKSGGSTSTAMTAKLGALVIRKNGVAVFNGVPCYRKSDSVAGLYDTVSETFFTNASGSGAFSVGSDV